MLDIRLLEVDKNEKSDPNNTANDGVIATRDDELPDYIRIIKYHGKLWLGYDTAKFREDVQSRLAVPISLDLWDHIDSIVQQMLVIIDKRKTSILFSLLKCCTPMQIL